MKIADTLGTGKSVHHYLYLKMKFSFLLLLISLLQVHAKSYAQKESFDLNMESATIDEVFSAIQNQTGYRFLYNDRTVNLDRKISIIMEGRRIERLLNRIFKGTNITYTIIEKQIILNISEKNPTNGKIDEKPIERTKEPEEPQRIVSGRVVDTDGIPLFGVSVLIKGTQKGVATDEDGKYAVTVNSGEILIFSYLGFLDIEIPIGNELIYDVVMTETSFKLDGVELVSTGYQKIEKERATGSFERVKEQTLERKINQDIVSKIRGEVSGVLFDPNVNSRDNNNSLGITIRGTSSLRANTEPLVVVDGFPIRGGFNTINPNDVESISILKDAAAASIWGIRATNGVIVIVTKKGSRKNKLAIEASVNSSFTLKTDIFKSAYADPQTQTDYQIALFESSGYFDTDQLFDGALEPGRLSQVNRVYEALGLAERGDISQEDASSRIEAIRKTDGRKQYASLFLKPQLWNQYNLAASVGGEKYSARGSVTYNRNTDELMGDESDQFIVNFSNSFDLSSRLRVNASVNFSQNRIENSAGIGPGNYFDQYALNEAILDSDGNQIPASTLGFSQASSDLAQQRGYAYPWIYNLQQEFDNADNTSVNTEIRIQTGLTYELIDGLDLGLSYQYEYGQLNARNLQNEATFSTRSTVNEFTQIDNTGNVSGFPVPKGSILDQSFATLNTNTFRAQLNYDKDYKEGDHRLTAIAGYEARKVISETNNDRKYGFNEQSLLNILPDYSTLFPLPLEQFSQPSLIPRNADLLFVENRFISYYANASYSYLNKYTISGSTRLDDTNLFGSSKKFRNVPLFSVGLKWNLFQEFFNEGDTIDQLSLRATYGTNGNVDRSTSPFLQTKQGIDFITFGNIFSFISTVPNPFLRLEKTQTLNLGLDFGLFKNGLSGSIEYYRKNSIDLLADRQLNPTVGVNSTLLNTGELFNNGVDISLNFTLVNGDQFGWDTAANFSLNENELTKVDVAQEDVFSFVRGLSQVEGTPLNTIYSFRYAGLDGSGAPQYINGSNELARVSEDITDTNALINEGTTTPRYYGSLINDFRYKNLSLRILTTYVAGHVFRNTNSFDPSNIGFNAFQDFNNRWQNIGDENMTDIPALPSNFQIGLPGYQNYRFADKFVDNAANIRLSEIIFGYQFPRPLVERLSMESFQLSLQAQNLKVWNFNKWNVDPLNVLFPIRPTFSINLSASF
ncbi:SusC/RagA family TonB-linked outer membrane protein [Maribacter algarum]|uniref:SusC/RagA family TonB-linked outer membrane protein n=1 Tax=Maribacter algarum (ex Zhang et al. 2020) TaxID=2578118 RepID=A0A5S3PSZ2_9FLAO|nr:SusC/RagA family TonB-linked outer membrane protein [Maribacter algarum]TMM55800.1 SusC/RagA family TonB-linked outer membrane protein [Maribacter algarum]